MLNLKATEIPVATVLPEWTDVAEGVEGGVGGGEHVPATSGRDILWLVSAMPAVPLVGCSLKIL